MLLCISNWAVVTSFHWEQWSRLFILACMPTDIIKNVSVVINSQFHFCHYVASATLLLSEFLCLLIHHTIIWLFLDAASKNLWYSSTVLELKMFYYKYIYWISSSQSTSGRFFEKEIFRCNNNLMKFTLLYRIHGCLFIIIYIFLTLAFFIYIPPEFSPLDPLSVVCVSETS